MPAANAGIGAGDLIVELGNKTIGSATALTEALVPYHPGQRVTIGWITPQGLGRSATITSRQARRHDPRGHPTPALLPNVELWGTADAQSARAIHHRGVRSMTGQPPVLGIRFLDALELANELHGDQCRRGTETPFVAHLLVVCGLVLEDGGDEAEAIAALLHDAVEDGAGRPMLGLIEERFGERVAAIVEGCSDTGRMRQVRGAVAVA